MFMQNRAADPTAVEQISGMINRFNQLTVEVKNIEELQKRKILEIENLKKNMEIELSELRGNLDELRKIIDSATKIKTAVGREFKQIAKTDAFERLSKRIDSQNYEKRISRQELYRKLGQL